VSHARATRATWDDGTEVQDQLLKINSRLAKPREMCYPESEGKGDGMKALTEQTPVEIDTALAEIYGRYYAALDRLDRTQKDAEYTAKRVARQANPSKYDQDALAASQARVEAAQEAASAIYAETIPYQAEYNSRPWTRAWKVTNTGGHVHSSMYCQTCFPTTQFAWLPEVSGMPEAEIVELAASAACTVCYPTAPVDRPTRLFTQSERATQAEREAKTAAKIERERKRLEKAILPDGSELVVSLGFLYPERIKTLVTARKELADAFAWSHKDIESEGYQTLIAAIASKEGKTPEAVVEEAKARAAKRR